MIIGFTGTRKGMTDEQLHTLRDLLSTLHAKEFHTGECMGADYQAAHMAFVQGCKIVAHPPTDQKQQRVQSFASETREPKPFLERDADIVNETQALIAAPGEPIERRRSGTWYTVRFARRIGKPRYIIYPDGKVRHETKRYL